jgi:2-polyprenyl-3-methyl-5-hydroxy-6-metoxy-1,4-benzoquinol methylase
MSRAIDSLTSSTLKHLRGRWWDADFTEFLRETLQPRPGDRILDVGCGVGTAEVRLGQLGISQLRLHGVDLVFDRVRMALEAVRAHNVRAGFTTANATSLPFTSGAFDSTYCVAMLQHVADLTRAVQELSRVTKPGGRVLAVEPDNASRYWYSSSESGAPVFELATKFFRALEGQSDSTDLALGPKLSTIFSNSGIEPTAVRLFPVSVALLGSPPAAAWEVRRTTARAALNRVTDQSVRGLGEEFLAALDRYAAEAAAAGHRFVEIQNTMLFATVGQKIDHPSGG